MYFIIYINVKTFNYCNIVVAIFKLATKHFFNGSNNLTMVKTSFKR